MATRDVKSESAYVDLTDVKARLAEGIDNADVSASERIEAEFREEFLEGLEPSSCHDFEVWRIAIREEARTTSEAAIPYARRAVQLDPGDACSHAELLRLLVAAGQRKSAEEQYAVAVRQLEAYGKGNAPLGETTVTAIAVTANADARGSPRRCPTSSSPSTIPCGRNR